MGSESSDDSVASDDSADSVVVAAKACASLGDTNGIKTETGALGVVTTTHRGPDHEPPLLRLAPNTSPDKLAAAIVPTSRPLNVLFMLILKFSS